MPHKYNSDGAEMPQDSFVIPEGEYIMRIVKATEGQSKSGDYQVTCNLAVVEGEKKGFKVNYHRVTFLDPKKNPQAAGMSIHFLKTIGQPWQGEYEINPGFWEGKCFLAYLVLNDYQGFKSMKVKWVKALEKAQSQELDEVPF
jgi:hypothetical protein